MKSTVILKAGYWLIILAFLTLFFGSKWNSMQLAFFFSCMLLPIAILTTKVFNSYLVPQFVLTKRYIKFGLYFLYLIIVSLYLEMLVALLSFVVLANTNINVVQLDGISVVNLGVSLYFIVFGSSFISLALKFSKHQEQLIHLQTEQKKAQQTYLTIRANRHNHMVHLNDLFYLESKDDHVKVVTHKVQLITREKISKLHQQLPKHFIRVHRSFVVNLQHVHSYTSSTVQLKDEILPISRTYKADSIEALSAAKIFKS